MKYTVVVADDEEEIRRSLVRRVKWEEIGFEVVGEAENGADALELVEKLEPDPVSYTHLDVYKRQTPKCYFIIV